MKIMYILGYDVNASVHAAWSSVALRARAFSSSSSLLTCFPWISRAKHDETKVNTPLKMTLLRIFRGGSAVRGARRAPSSAKKSVMDAEEKQRKEKKRNRHNMKITVKRFPLKGKR
jgi:hypothetical protein